MASAVKIGIIGGSGLDNPQLFKNRKETEVETPFGRPSDALIEGEIDGVPCVLLARHGRKHTVAPGDINYRANVWALKEAGCTHLVVTTATGSLREEIRPGDFVIIDNFIDRTQGRKSTFYDGSPNSPKGVCHVPMEPAFCERTRNVILKTAESLGVKCHDRGTVVSIQGPRFSSKAESQMHRSWGGSLVNMTTVPEVVLAKEAGLCYAAIAIATDYDCWRETGERVSVEQVLATFKRNVGTLTELLTAIVPNIGKEDWTDTIKQLKETVASSVM